MLQRMALPPCPPQQPWVLLKTVVAIRRSYLRGFSLLMGTPPTAAAVHSDALPVVVGDCRDCFPQPSTSIAEQAFVSALAWRRIHAAACTGHVAGGGTWSHCRSLLLQVLRAPVKGPGCPGRPSVVCVCASHAQAATLQELARPFAELLAGLCDCVFEGLEASKLTIFVDRGTDLRAFNRHGHLFFNLHYFKADSVQSELYAWFVVRIDYVPCC